MFGFNIYLSWGYLMHHFSAFCFDCLNFLDIRKLLGTVFRQCWKHSLWQTKSHWSYLLKPWFFCIKTPEIEPWALLWYLVPISISVSLKRICQHNRKYEVGQGRGKDMNLFLLNWREWFWYLRCFEIWPVIHHVSIVMNIVGYPYLATILMVFLYNLILAFTFL